MSSSTIKVTLPEDFSPDDRAYFYQSLSAINYFLLPGTEMQLQTSLEKGETTEKTKYHLTIHFNQTVVTASLVSESYHDAVKSLMASLQIKFTNILKNVVKKEAKKVKSDGDGEDEKKVIH